jgi:hypothetical protein
MSTEARILDALQDIDSKLSDLELAVMGADATSAVEDMATDVECRLEFMELQLTAIMDHLGIDGPRRPDPHA